jgi:hypothetical protein
MVCGKCGSENNVKNGKICGFQFAKEAPDGQRKEEKDRAAAKLFRADVPTVPGRVRDSRLKIMKNRNRKARLCLNRTECGAA